MCNLLNKSEAESITGYKVVAEIDGKNYSIAMGFCYDDHEEIPVVEEQKCLGYFNEDILYDAFAFSKDMKGRTAIFLNYLSALELAMNIAHHHSMKGIRVVLKIARISKDIMLGEYGPHQVAAGRKIEFLGDV